MIRLLLISNLTLILYLVFSSALRFGLFDKLKHCLSRKIVACGKRMMGAEDDKSDDGPAVDSSKQRPATEDLVQHKSYKPCQTPPNSANDTAIEKAEQKEHTFAEQADAEDVEVETDAPQEVNLAAETVSVEVEESAEYTNNGTLSIEEFGKVSDALTGRTERVDIKTVSYVERFVHCTDIMEVIALQDQTMIRRIDELFQKARLEHQSISQGANDSQTKDEDVSDCMPFSRNASDEKCLPVNKIVEH